MNRFIGIWQNRAGNKLIIKEKNEKRLSVTLISGKTNEPIRRSFANNQPTVDMDAELDFYKTSLEVELWEIGKGFHLCLSFDYYAKEQIELSPGLSVYEEDKELYKYFSLFEPLDNYIKIE